MKNRKFIFLGVLVAFGCGLFVLEAQLPPIAAVPGIKPGLANLITLLAISWYGPKDAALCLGCRILLTSLFVGQGVYFLYSLAGGIVCFLVLLLFKKAPLWARSAFAAIGHNVGQLLVAVVLVGNISVLWLLLYLTIGAIISGSIIGVAATICIRRLSRFVKGEVSCRNLAD